MSNPAQLLLGYELEGGWKVIQKVDPGPLATGGHFSVGYLVKRSDGKDGYLKALDFSAAFQEADVARALEAMTRAYNFERDLLNKCRDRKMKRVVTPLADGTLRLDGALGPQTTVCYLIFEIAEGDIRKYRQTLKEFDLAWCLRSMHHTAVGLNQLHSSGIAHQDVKPSNVLVFAQDGSKIADLGRATDVSTPFVNDKRILPGDTGYAPPEQFYGFAISDSFEKERQQIFISSAVFSFFSLLMWAQHLLLRQTLRGKQA